MTQHKTLQLLIPRETAQEIPANPVAPLPTAALFSQLKPRKGTSPEESRGGPRHLCLQAGDNDGGCLAPEPWLPRAPC